MALGWEGELVRLLPMDVGKHFENALRWSNDPENTAHGHLSDFPSTRLMESDWVEAQSKQNEKEVSLAIELLSGEHIGFCGIYSINWQDRTATTGILIGREFWGKGYGSDAVRLRARYAFEILGLRYLVSTVLDGNDSSMRMLTRNGYVECGRLPKKVWLRGGYVDEVLFYLTKEMWQAKLKE